MENRNNLSTSDLAATTESSEPGDENRDRDPLTASDEALARDPDDGASDGATAHEPLLPHDESARFGGRWQEIQTGFVDEPRRSVEQADALVADLMQRLAASFAEERQQLEAQWDRGDDVTTEDLRVALTRYRSFFDRLLSA